MDFPLVNGALSSALDWAHLIVREWFLERFATPTEPQEAGWPHILARRNTIISAPTGSGKTLAAFLACIDSLVRKALRGELADQTEVLYVSPLKALGNDIQKNLELPLGEILQRAVERGLLLPPIRVAVRTGDTPMNERRAMLRRPPHILVTTPESLYILLTAESSREMLRHVETVIVDEIHAVADDKRGAHLALSLERLEALLDRPPVRIGLSATQKPIERVAQFLAGSDRPAPVVIDVGHRRAMDIAIEVPASELSAVASNEMWGEIYDRIAALAGEHRSTLVFVNTRRLAERVAHHLAERIGKEFVASHHGSLARKLRLTAERRLKAGELRVLVATASLELGIDIGHVDLVCHIGSSRSIGVALQRLGRAGHWRGAVPKGRLFATTCDELLECAALVRAIRRGELDELLIPEAPLDVLAQQVVAACAAEEWQEDELFALVRSAYPYRALSRSDFDAVLNMVSDGISARRGRYGSYVFRDRVNHRLRGRRGSRLAAITSGGAIPENALYTVVATPEDAVVGTVDEDFAVESLAGDIMLLGNSSWRIRRVERGRVLVEDAQGAPPNVPFWRGEAPGRTAELSAQLAELRERIGESISGDNANPAGRSAAIEWLKQECGLDDAGAAQAVDYILMGRAVLGAVPSQALIIAERFFDESGGMQLVIHAPFGARINKAWGLALRKRFCRSFNFELQAAATDNGLNISLGEQHSFPLGDVFHYLQAASVKEVLEQAVLAAPLFTVRWRWAAGRSLALLRFQGGKKMPPQIQRMRAEDLLAAVFPQAIAEVRADAWPDVRDADELHDALLTLVALPEPEDPPEPASASCATSALQESVARSIPAWRAFFAELTAEQRATRALLGRRAYWVSAERAQLFRQVLPGAAFASSLPEIGDAAVSREDALFALLGGWMAHAGPTTEAELSHVLGLPSDEIAKALLRLEANGSILRGQFTAPGPHQPDAPPLKIKTEWCDRRLLARIHRLTVGELRKQIQPVTPAQFMRWLLRWQHLAPGAQLAGERGVLEVLGQLQGFEAPANAWERQILQRRIAGYTPATLDQLCLTGAVGWAGAASRPIHRAWPPGAPPRVPPTRRPLAAASCPPASRPSPSSSATTPTG